MSDADVELVRRNFEAWNNGNLERVLADYSQDAVIVSPADWPEEGEIHGHDGIRAQFVFDAWADAYDAAGVPAPERSYASTK